MSKNVAVFVDVANLYYAARGQDVDVDYVALLKHATKGRDLIRAYAYSGLDPENENQKKFLEFLGKNGYRVVAKDIRKFGDGRVKANLDIELVVDLFRLADRMDVAVIVSGDGDFAPAIRALQDQGVRCEVISFKPNTSSDLFAVADEFVDAMKISSIGRAREAKGVGAPEMPAKEVNPDVGFREASPSVAAAALAAIRSDGGETARGGRGRGRGTRRPARGAGNGEPAAATTASRDEAPAREPGATTEAGDSESESARRRRRRGGRGRGRRGRRGEGLETSAAEGADLEPAEVTWQELDSLDDLDGGTAPDSDTEVAFEEADAATLAELGLTEQPAASAATDADAPAEVVSKPRSQTRKSATTAKTKAPAEGKAPAKARASKARTTSGAPASASASASASAKAKPKSSTSTAEPAVAKTSRSRRSGAKSAKPASRSTGDATPSGDSSDEGIWKRLTSARGTKRAAPKPPAED